MWIALTIIAFVLVLILFFFTPMGFIGVKARGEYQVNYPLPLGDG